MILSEALTAARCHYCECRLLKASKSSGLVVSEA